LTPDATPEQNPRVGYHADYLGGVFVDPAAANSTNGSRRSSCSQTSAPLIASVKTADQLGRARPSMTQHVYATGGRVHTEVAPLLDRAIGIADE
jgi:hypothetical protein